MTTTFLRAAPQGTTEWLAQRAAPTSDGLPPVGGSDVSALLGIHSFANMGEAGTPNTRAGHALELLLADRMAEVLDLPPFEADWMIRDDWRRGTLDGVLFDDELVAVLAPGVDVVRRVRCTAECKVVFLGQRHHWRRQRDGSRLDGLPLFVHVQGLWYLALTGTPVHIGALLVDEYSPTESAAQIAATAAMRMYTLTPELDGADAALLVERVAERRLVGPAPAIDTTPEGSPTHLGTFDEGVLLARLAAAKAALSAAEATEAKCKAAVKALFPPGVARIEAGGRTATLSKNGALRLT